jgi:1-acyl-sn-glycerol-3-phosphate acyltransferase
MSDFMARLRSAVFSVVFLTGTAIAIVVGLCVGLLGQRVLHAYVNGWTRFHALCAFLILGIRSRVEGPVPAGPVLIACKHESMFETLELMHVLRHPGVVAKRELTDFPLWRWVTRLYGMVPVDREASAAALRAMLRATDPIREQGRSLLIFPEGTRVAPGDTPPLRPGLAGLYARWKLPIVPVALNSGTHWPKHGPKRPGTIVFRFGDPIPPGLPRAEMERRVWEGINAMNLIR